ncbi:hypothetical protein NMG60_11026681 [Bertholletia excelsa]
MDISTMLWLEYIDYLELHSLGFCTDRAEVEMGKDQLFAGLNLVWNGALKFHPEVDNSEILEASVRAHEELSQEFCDSSLLLDGNMEDLMDFCYEKHWASTDAASEFQGCTEIHMDGDGGEPHDGLFFALAYLGVRDLLSVERVCKSLRDAVQNDPLLWRSIHIDHPLSERLTDDALLRLTSRAQGTLQCLSLMQCMRVTDNALWHVLESNPGLTKLSVPGCVKLSVDGILFYLKAYKLAGKRAIKHLRIAGLHVTNKQFEELKLLVGSDNHKELGSHKPRFFGRGQLYLSCDDGRAIDIEACPRCHRIRQVYDCPAESCQGKYQSAQLCRGCTFCIARCFECGCCINGRDYEETFFLDFRCLDCFMNGQKLLQEVGVHSSTCTIIHQQAAYYLSLRG